jgi:hypothetical protein
MNAKLNFIWNGLKDPNPTQIKIYDWIVSCSNQKHRCSECILRDKTTLLREYNHKHFRTAKKNLQEIENFTKKFPFLNGC